MKRQSRIWERIMAGADLESEPMPLVPLVELAGDRRVLIENHQGVVEYGQQQIRVRVRYGMICVCGCGLEMTRMTKEQLVITGRIDSVGLIRRKC